MTPFPRKSPDVEPSIGLGQDVRWEKRKFSAAALEWKERVLHGVTFVNQP